MSGTDDTTRFTNIGFDDFRRLASDPALSPHEKIGFPDSYRHGKGAEILADIASKLAPLRTHGAVVLDVGPGCSDLPKLLISHCRALGQELHLVDSAEMLDALGAGDDVRKTVAFYPDCPELLSELAGRTDAVLVYSVLQYIFVEANLWRFLDETLALLAPGGMLLLGDIPNSSMRRRFLASAAGHAYHRAYSGRDEDPGIDYGRIDAGQIDDSVVFAILQRARAAGFHAYVLPQRAELPMANRREDILVVRP